MNEKILLFLMLGGIQLASEGNLTLIKHASDIGLVLWEATQPETGEHFLINLTHAIAIQEVDRVSVSTTPRKILIPKDN